MAVEARHVNPFSSQFFTSSEIIKPNLSNAAELYNAPQMDSTLISLPLPLPSSTMAEPLLPFYPSTVCDLASAKTSMNKADSGLTCHIPAPIINRKRPRDLIAESTNAPPALALPIPHAKINKLSSETSSFLDQDILYQIQNQQSEIDHFISQYTEKLRMELEKQRVRQSRTLLSGIQEAMVKKLKEKDEEIQRMGKLNWVLQERVKSLCVENQIWRELAQTNEATVNSLRSNLEQVLAHVGDEPHTAAPAAPAEPDDAESSCGSNDNNNDDDDNDNEERRCFTAAAPNGWDDTAASGGDATAATTGRMCRKCGVRESIVLLLPCRHLCVCTMCGSMVRNCPVCHSGMNASVHVNFS